MSTEEYVRHVVDQAPPLTDHQVAVLRGVFAPTARAHARKKQQWRPDRAAA